jgi:hypothetical protein
MPQYDIQNPETGTVITVEGDRPPNDDELEPLFTQAEKQKKQSTLGEIGSALKGRAKELASDIGNKNFSLPTKIASTVGDIAGAVTDIPSIAIKRGVEGLAPQSAKDMASKGAQAYMKATNAIPGVQEGNAAIEAHPELKKNIENALNISSVLPIGGAAADVGGNLMQSAAKKALRGEAKITDVVARKAAPTITAGKTKIINDIADKNLQSSGKGFSGISENAQKQIDDKMETGSDALKSAQAANPDKTISLDKAGNDYQMKLLNDQTDIPFDQAGKANEVMTDLMAKLKKKLGKNPDEPAELSFDEANKARQLLSKGVFKKGAFNTNDPLVDQVKQDLALTLRDALGEHVPELAAANKDIRDLINIKKAAEAASSRIAGHNQVLGYGNAIAATAGSLLSPNHELGAAAGYLTKKALESGRGASAALSTGKALAKAGSKLPDNAALIGLNDKNVNQGQE